LFDPYGFKTDIEKRAEQQKAIVNFVQAFLNALGATFASIFGLIVVACLNPVSFIFLVIVIGGFGASGLLSGALILLLGFIFVMVFIGTIKGRK